MANWIVAIFEQLLNALDEMLDIVDLNGVLQMINVFEQTPLTKKQLYETNIIETVEDLHDQSPNQYLKYRLEILLSMWRKTIKMESSKQRKARRRSHSVFEAVIMDDDQFFKTKSVPELLNRLLKSFDRNYKVIDMATVLNTIEVFEKINISPSKLATTHLVTYVRRLRRNTTNRYLEKRLRNLLKKWRDSLTYGATNAAAAAASADKKKHTLRYK